MSEIGTRTQTEKPDGEWHSYGETSCSIGLVNCLLGLAGADYYFLFFWRGHVTALYVSLVLWNKTVLHDFGNL